MIVARGVRASVCFLLVYVDRARVIVRSITIKYIVMLIYNTNRLPYQPYLRG